MNLENVMLSEKSQAQKATILCDSVYTNIFPIGKSMWTESRLVVAKACGGGEDWERLLMGKGFGGVNSMFCNESGDGCTAL